MSAKGKKKQDGKKNYFGPKKCQNKFKISSGSKGPKGYSYVCGKHGNYVRDCKKRSPKARQMLFKPMII